MPFFTVKQVSLSLWLMHTLGVDAVTVWESLWARYCEITIHININVGPLIPSAFSRLHAIFLSFMLLLKLFQNWQSEALSSWRPVSCCTPPSCSSSIFLLQALPGLLLPGSCFQPFLRGTAILLQGAFAGQNPVTRCAHCCRVVAPRPSQWAEVGHGCYSHAYFCLAMYITNH